MTDEVAEAINSMRMAMESLKDRKPWLATDDVHALDAVRADIEQITKGRNTDAS